MAKLSDADKLHVDNFDKSMGYVLDTILRAQQFKEGDFLVLKIESSNNGHFAVQTNTYGAPVKYRVVHTNKHGTAFVKRINKHGEPIGPISSCLATADDEYISALGSTASNTGYGLNSRRKHMFELDPDYADSLLLSDDYDPTSLHRSKKDIWKAVTEHNKACKIPTSDLDAVIAFFKTVTAGDTIWTSNIGSYFVEDITAANVGEHNKTCNYRLRTRFKGQLVTILTIRGKNGKTKKVPPDFFCGKAIYRQRPRTYRELNI